MDEQGSDVLVIGAGPAGITAALAIAETGRSVRIIDPSRASVRLPPRGNYLALRATDRSQWRWQVGAATGALAAMDQTSPKLRIPGLRGIFEGYAEANHLHADPGFHLVGAMAAGGMSNAWGCGVTRFTRAELGALGAYEASMLASYARVATRMGLSGANDDDIAAAVGVDEWADPPLPLDRMHAALYRRRDRITAGPGLSLGHTRLAVLARARGAREACDLAGLCLWGCPTGATWSAAFDLPQLRARPGVVWDPGWSAQRLDRNARGGWDVQVCAEDGVHRTLHAQYVLLAAGTLASTRLALAALQDPPARVRLLSNPMAAFLLCLPRFLGQAREPAFGLAQLSLRLDVLGSAGPAWAHTFSTAGLPVSELLPYLPLTRRAGLPLLRALLPATLFGNAFFPGEFSAHHVELQHDGALKISGGESTELAPAREQVRRTLVQAYRRAGAWMLPGSFIPGAWGADLHYAATLPIRDRPAAHECHASGQIAGLPGVYAVDGASLPTLPAKAHTLTIMANADRIARGIPHAAPGGG